ncbi:bifunctional (p)ppGpp synthetase/guanosine-3',5'-bis(diphosphate) 3'-pyrophosphohydrolase [Diaphorobacter ruginosibacter]|uniref:Bifunctional (P)ppGpp synthetase/guanosine-3',5'-bis(Diphosphate) 3'-pyrophosphohydrolase n=1 Tax=Diaphorobacter ruginosibacter TaxID=1715720 RepID=A0A7G9RRR8_9BURK|nr:bifunctional (p)ppGpp synthetase/guanosine-3',5'-bis(diphosphate) 3'-pyrophosphohydrolase [Diaphorobacter ruginosibacter]QNN58293.1 bifunctional (p)ppGpp synthetase/guanosine-3',5'-bis(diphosphate) 3'-pyrophosphohydrolase [Diaphorobacter ruginosibacter]
MSNQASATQSNVSAPAKPAGAGAAAANAAAASFAALLEKLDYLDDASIEQVRQAYRFADQAHLGQMRNSGEPYITHPIAVAALCASWKLDAQALSAALLHDAMEDCGVTKSDLVTRFGASVAEMVDGLTKLDKLQFDTREENQAESFRKMLLAMARDVRVILIKLADRTHNMRTLDDMPRSKWRRISSETLDIYVPIAHRLGLNQTFRELQELAFRHLHPWRYATLEKAVNRARSRRRDLVTKVQAEVDLAFGRIGMNVRLAGREKTMFSIYEKMTEKHLSFAKVTDIYGFRVIVPTVTDCYTALGVLHQMYKPVPGKFKDHIAIAKVNGYQSLHTTLVGPAGVNIEFQIRTEEMNVVAEAGVAAHWLYKEVGGAGASSVERMGTKWLQSLLDIQNETRDAAEFWDHVRVDLFPDAVYVFTPKSQIMALPRGATVVDFAYAVHTDVGDRAVAAKINGEQVPLRTELRNGDVVEIISMPDSHPNPAWLAFVRTGRARSKIRRYLKTMELTESASLGEKLLTQAVRAEGMEGLPDEDAQSGIWEKLLRFTGSRTRSELMTDIGLGKRVASIVAKRMALLMSEDGQRPDALLLTRERYSSHETISQGGITLDGSEGASVQYAQCCRPVPGDPITGYLGRGEGLVVHNARCAVAQKLQAKDGDRFISVDWAEEPSRTFETGIVVTVTNGKGVLARVAAELANSEADIVRVEMEGEAMEETIDLRFLIMVQDATHLEAILRNLRRTHSVLRVLREIPLAA